MMTDDLPTFRAGDPVSAAALTKLADAMRGTDLGPGTFHSNSERLQRRQRSGGPGGGDVTFAFCVVTEAITGKTGEAPADWGVGMVQLLDDSGNETGSEIEVRSRYYSSIPVGAPGYVSDAIVEGYTLAVNFDCRTEPGT